MSALRVEGVQKNWMGWTIKFSHEDAHGDGVILLDNVSKTSICKGKSTVNNVRNARYNMELETNYGTRIIEE